VAQEGTAAFKAALADLQADLGKEDGVINQQRKAIVEDFGKERAAITETIRQERTATVKELDVITKKAIDQTAEKIKDLVNGALGLLILFVLVLWGLPFGAGFLVGRVMKKKT
jgi:predicted RNA-binding protein Jag